MWKKLKSENLQSFEIFLHRNTTTKSTASYTLHFHTSTISVMGVATSSKNIRENVVYFYLSHTSNICQESLLPYLWQFPKANTTCCVSSYLTTFCDASCYHINAAYPWVFTPLFHPPTSFLISTLYQCESGPCHYFKREEASHIGPQRGKFLVGLGVTRLL